MCPTPRAPTNRDDYYLSCLVPCDKILLIRSRPCVHRKCCDDGVCASATILAHSETRKPPRCLCSNLRLAMASLAGAARAPARPGRRSGAPIPPAGKTPIAVGLPAGPGGGGDEPARNRRAAFAWFYGPLRGFTVRTNQNHAFAWFYGPRLVRPQQPTSQRRTMGPPPARLGRSLLELPAPPPSLPPRRDCRERD